MKSESNIHDTCVAGIFRKKPTEVMAVRMPNADVWAKRIAGHTVSITFEMNVLRLLDFDVQSMQTILDDTPDGLRIKTLEGWLLASPGDWIVRGIAGELYPVKPEIFAAIYDFVAEV